LAPAYLHQVSRLDNGLTLVTIDMPHLHSASLAVYARVGSRHESAEDNGLSHFLEHMFFRGCDGYADSTALNAAMEDLGGWLDGFTTRDYSGYQSTVHPDHVDEALALYAQMFRSPLFSEIDIERSIILEEILDAVDPRGRTIDLDILAHKEAFPEHPLGNSIDGPRANLKRFNRDDLERHRRRFYGAQNLVVCAAGQIKPAQVKKNVQKNFGPLFAGKPVKEGKAPGLPPKAPHLRLVNIDESQVRIRLSFRGISDVHDDYPALLVLRRILDGGLSARLQVEMVERRGIAYEIGAELVTYSDCGLLDFEMAVAPNKLAYAIEELGKVIAGLSQNITPSELASVKRRAGFGVMLGLDSAGELSHWFGATQLFHEPIPPETRLAQLEKVTLKDVEKVAKKYLKASRLTGVAVGKLSPALSRTTQKAFKAFCAASG